MAILNQAEVVVLLSSYRPFDGTEAEFQSAILRFVSSTANFASRIHNPGHLTASGWILNHAQTHALLIQHAKLGRWLQPGGHIEPDDASLAAAASREVREETGLSLTAEPALFDIDIHRIPAHGSEVEHCHYDCRFLFRCDENAAIRISGESRGIRWVALAGLATSDTPESLRRMALKSGTMGS